MMRGQLKLLWENLTGHIRAAARALPVIRLRLALLYGGLVLMAGIVLLGITYALVASHQQPIEVRISDGIIKVNRGPSSAPNFVFLARIAPGAASPLPPNPKTFTKLQSILNRTLAAQQAADRDRLLTQGAEALAVVAVLALVAGWLVAGRILRPLQVMTTTARRLSTESPGGRIGLVGPRDELKNLADTFDALLDRLDAALAAEKRFVANVSHELRTPLTIQRTLLEVGLSDPEASTQSLRRMAERLWDVNQRSGRLIDGLLALARSEQGVQVQESVDLVSVVHDAIEAALPEVSALGLHLESRLQPVALQGDRILLERMAGNLIENAVRYNVRDGWVRVTTRAAGDDGILTVVNTGPVLAQSDVADLFQPFRRGVQERTNSARGAGLGLSIVRAVATAHHGRVEATARSDGGLTVSVILPVEAD